MAVRSLARLAALVLVACSGAAAGSGAVAQERPSSAGQVTPYIWAIGAGGRFQPFAGGPVLEVDRSFSDLLADLDAALFLSGYLRVDRFVLVGDFSYSSATRSGLVPPGLPAAGRLRQTSLTLASGYRVVDAPGATLDLLIGARAWWVRADVDLAGAIQRSPRLDFVDPIVAARGNVALAPRLSALAYADVGGFGAGSDATFQVVGTINYRIAESVFLSAGYRHLQVEYDSGGTDIDLRLSGPLFGATIRF
jgi:hypothetical protein